MQTYKSYATGADVAINPGDVYHTRRVREGKTQRDHANGNPRRNAERKALRAEWQHDNRASSSNFPV